MIIQNKEFPEGQLVIYTDYRRSEHAGAGGCFQIFDICIEGNSDNSILKDLNIDQGTHYHSIEEVLHDLLLSPDLVDYREEVM